MSKKDDARQRLIGTIKSVALEKREKLENLKKEYSQLKRPDFIWHYLLQSFSTMGSSRGWDGLIRNQNNYQKVTFFALSNMNYSNRLSILEQTISDAKVRMPMQKARWLALNYDYILSLGGLLSTKEKLLNIRGRNGKIDFLQSFIGIGEKYARNIMMDQCCPVN